jgi:hypothetical protein
MTSVELNVVIEDQVVSVSAPTPSVNVSTISQPLTVVTLEGPPGPRGLPGNGAVIHGETPAGTQDGTNLVFTLANNFQAGTVSMYRNGLRGTPGYDYSETLPNQITFTTAPAADDAIVVDYYIG